MASRWRYDADLTGPELEPRISGTDNQGMLWNGKWYRMEREFWYGIRKMLRMEWKI